MNISPPEAEEALATIHKMAQKTRRSIASSGAYVFLIITGIVWLVGFLATQFLTGALVAVIWVGVSLLGTALSIPLGNRLGKRVHSPAFDETARRAGLFWLFLILFGISAIAIAHPADGKQVAMFVILFVMLGQMAMGLILSFSATWWALPITALALVGYFFFPNVFYLWMGVLIGGGMILLGLYIRSRW